MGTRGAGAWVIVRSGPPFPVAIETLVTDAARYLSNDVATTNPFHLRRIMAGFRGRPPPFH